MATVTGFTAARMKEIEDATVINGGVVDDDLVLVRRDGGTINAGNVRGPAGFQGPPGDLSDAPADGKLWVRKDGAWYALATNATMTAGVTYGLRNNAWEAINLPTDAPNDNQKYLIKNDTYVRADRAWKLEFNDETAVLPSGFSVGTVVVDPDPYGSWSISLTGSGYQVNYVLEYVYLVMGTLTPITRFTLPTNLRPIVTVEHDAAASQPHIATYHFGYARQQINTAGQITTPHTRQAIVATSTGTDVPGTGTRIKIEARGSYTRATDDLPSTATYI